jgi:hypothetical protein
VVGGDWGPLGVGVGLSWPPLVGSPSVHRYVELIGEGELLYTYLPARVPCRTGPTFTATASAMWHPPLYP